MTEKDIILKEELKYTGYCDFRALYNFMHDWLKDEQCDITEDVYEEKIKGDEKEIVVKWRISKKVTDYFKIDIDLKMEIKHMKDVEVEIDGKKKKMNELEIKVVQKGILVKDYESKWAGSASGKFFKELYDKFVIPKRTEDMESKVEDLVQDLKEQIKAFLELTGKK